MEKGCRTSRIVPEQVVHFSAKGRILPRRQVSLLQLLERRHEHLRNVAPSVGAKVSQRIWNCRRIHFLVSTGACADTSRRAASMKRRTRTASFLPGLLSKREHAS